MKVEKIKHCSKCLTEINNNAQWYQCNYNPNDYVKRHIQILSETLEAVKYRDHVDAEEILKAIEEVIEKFFKDYPSGITNE